MMRLCFVFAALIFSAELLLAAPIPIANHSFEIPYIDPIANPYMAVPYAPYWIELDVDTDPLYGGRNTGVFRNTEPNSIYDHIVGVDPNQLAFLGTMAGNALLQEIDHTYKIGCSYRLTVGLCPSKRYPPQMPMDKLLITFYVPGASDANDIFIEEVWADEITQNIITEFSAELPPVRADERWARQQIGIGFRASGTTLLGYWDLDNVRLTEIPPNIAGETIVNLQDFAVMASQWGLCPETDADLTGEGCFDIEDLIILAEHWLEDV